MGAQLIQSMNCIAFMKYLPRDDLDHTQKLTKGMLVKGGQCIPYASFLASLAFQMLRGF